MSRRLPIELITLFYFLSYLPNIIMTKLVTTTPNAGLGRPPTGLETLPASLIVSLVLTYIFIFVSGWHRDAHGKEVGRVRVPVWTRSTFLSGIGTALVLFTVPLSFTFEGVSIPFIQLLMRGDILIIAPLVDLMFGRKVRWWSWVALVMVAISLAFVVQQRGGFHLPPLAILTVILYTVGYFIRLAVMTSTAKSGDPALVRRYFVEEKLVALPMSVAALAILSWSGIGAQAGQLSWGFIAIWSDPVVWWLIGIGTSLTIISIFAAVILLDARENSYCVPLERASSLLAGIAAAYLLAWFWGLKAPTAAETIGASILVAAIILLSVAPRFSRAKVGARAEG
jgi:drug/metabolite transporter (DMT)-like permease